MYVLVTTYNKAQEGLHDKQIFRKCNFSSRQQLQKLKLKQSEDYTAWRQNSKSMQTSFALIVHRQRPGTENNSPSITWYSAIQIFKKKHLAKFLCLRAISMSFTILRRMSPLLTICFVCVNQANIVMKPISKLPTYVLQMISLQLKSFDIINNNKYFDISNIEQ